MKSMLSCNYIVSVLGLVVGGAIAKAASAFPLEFTKNGPGPGFWPFSLGVAMILAAALLLAYTLTHKQELGEELVSLTTSANKRVYMLMGIIVVFVVLISLLGFFGAGLVLIPAIMLLMGYTDKKVIALTTFGTLAFIYVVFCMILSTQLPQSIFLQ